MLGLDFASVDSNTKPDFKKAFNAGARFIFIRGMQRLITKDLVDPCYARDAARARDAGLVVGAYLFPSYHFKAPSPKEQVAAFKHATVIGGVLAGKDLPPALDVESKDWKATGHSKKELVALTEMFVRELQDQFGCRPFVYTSYFQAEDLGLPTTAPWLGECPLWIKTAYQLKAGSKYDSKLTPRTPHLGYDRVSDPKNYCRYPDPWNASGWFVQQYLGDVTGFPGFDKTLDVNRFQAVREGDQGPQVRWVQRRLSSFSPLKIDGDFGAKTANAVRNYQTANRLIVDGEVALRTFSSLAWS